MAFRIVKARKLSWDVRMKGEKPHAVPRHHIPEDSKLEVTLT